MSWLFFVVVGQFFYAVAVLVDRFIVSKGVVSKPIVYAFYVNLLSIFAVIVVPFGVSWPSSMLTITLSLAAAVSFTLSILFLYESLRNANTSEVVPVIGGVAALSAFIFSSIILNDTIPGHFAWGFIILTVGMLLISHFKFTARSFIFLSCSGIFFGLSTVITKLILEDETLINGFFWSRMGNVVIALLLLLIPSIYHAIKHDHTRPSNHKKHHKTLLIVGNKVLGALGFICVLIALKSGNASLVNALTATQYIFLLTFALFFSRLLPEYFEEKVHKHEFLHKSLATILIVVGFFVLFL